MAPTYYFGYAPGIGLDSKDIDIEQEDLLIILSDTTTEAQYKVKYYINNQKEDGELTLIFDVVQEYSKFEVSLDNNPIDLTPTNTESIEQDTLYPKLKNWKLFRLNISKGTHLIEVKYIGYPNEYLGNWLTEYTYPYNLEPAKSWASFHKLNLTIDATSIPQKDIVKFDIQDSTYLIQGTSHTWQFDSIPQSSLYLTYQPKGNLPFLTYPDSNVWIVLIIFVTFVILIILFIINIYIALRWRNKHKDRSYSPPIIIGSFAVPLLVALVYLYCFQIIDSFIGSHASRFHVYYTLVAICAYPVLALIYFIINRLIDLIYKNRLNKQK